MVRGVAEHGLPYTQNGPAENFPELRARWNVLRHGHLWGQYPPLFAYVAAPFYRLGGLRAVIRLNLALLIVVALGTYALGRKLSRDPLIGTAAAYVTVLGAPVWTLSGEVSSYTLGIALITWAMYFALAATQAPATRARRPAFIAGLLGGLASATHLFVFPMALGAAALLSVLRTEDSHALGAETSTCSRLRALVPTRAIALRGACAFAGLALALAPVSVLNHVRFGSWNPVTYGPCVWRSCVETGASNQTPAAMLAHIGPVFAYVAAFLALAWLLRASRTSLAVLGAMAYLLSAPESELHRRGYFFLAILCGYLVDASSIPLRSPYVAAKDGLGNYMGPYVLKSTLQSNPAFGLAFAPLLETPEDRRMFSILALPCVGVYLLFALRSNMPSEHAIGYSSMHFRYVIPTVPVWSVLALWSVRDLPWRRWHPVLVVMAALAIGAWLMRWPDDASYIKRFYLLRVTLALALASFVLVVRARNSGREGWKHAAALAFALALASAFATTLAVDARAAWKWRNAQDARSDAVTRLIPARAAVVGWAPELDAALTGPLVQRNVIYADLYEAENWANFRTLIDLWMREGRPIYALFPTHVEVRNPWSELRFEPIDRSLGLVRIVPARP